MEWGLEQGCSQQPRNVLQMWLMAAGPMLISTSPLGPAPTVFLTSLPLPFVSPGGQRHLQQPSDAGLVEELGGGLSPEERKRFAQGDEAVQPQPFPQENQRRNPAAVAGEGGGAACQEAQGLGSAEPRHPSSSWSPEAQGVVVLEGFVDGVEILGASQVLIQCSRLLSLFLVFC